MTTTAQVHQALQPLLDRNPDVALIGRRLVIRPVHHIMRSIFVDRSSIKVQFVPSTSVSLMFLGEGVFRTAMGDRLYRAYIDPKELVRLNNAPMPAAEPLDSANPYAAGKVLVTPDMGHDIGRHNHLLMIAGRWEEGIRTEGVIFDITIPASIRVMCDMIESEVLPMLKALTSFADFVAFRASLGHGDWHPYPVGPFDRMLIASAEGNFQAAQELWHSDEEDKTRFMAREPAFYPALMAGDRATIAGMLNRWEAWAVKEFRLERYWECTPFPLER